VDWIHEARDKIQLRPLGFKGTGGTCRQAEYFSPVKVNVACLREKNVYMVLVGG
jgi:hypothetical protein